MKFFCDDLFLVCQFTVAFLFEQFDLDRFLLAMTLDASLCYFLVCRSTVFAFFGVDNLFFSAYLFVAFLFISISIACWLELAPPRSFFSRVMRFGSFLTGLGELILTFARFLPEYKSMSSSVFIFSWLELTTCRVISDVFGLATSYLMTSSYCILTCRVLLNRLLAFLRHVWRRFRAPFACLFDSLS